MSAILRLKRKRNEESTDTIVLSCKRSKPGDEKLQREVFRLAGTTNDLITDAAKLSSFKDNIKRPNPVEVKPNTSSINRKIRLVQVNDGTDQPLQQAAYSSVDNKAVRVYDAVLNDALWPAPKFSIGLDDEIACNGEVMTKVNTSSLTTNADSITSEDDDYVYDIFYLDGESAGFDHITLEDMLCIEAFGEDYSVFREYRDDQRLYEDDDDDSNDEDNWRNDYPDEDVLSSDEDEYRSGDEFHFDGLNFDGIKIASDEDELSDLSDDDADLDGFGSEDPEFRKYYRSYKKSCHRLRNEFDDEASESDNAEDFYGV